MGMPVIVNSEIGRNGAITDIIQSVALQQTALSHILNAEGEKIQYMLANAKDTDTVLETNKSVRNMVESITRLEMVLQSKLGLFDDALCTETTVKEETKEPEAETEPEVEAEPEPEPEVQRAEAQAEPEPVDEA